MKNVIERLMIMCSSEKIDVNDLPVHIHSPKIRSPFQMKTGLTLKDLRDRVEREYILSTLKKNNWNVSKTAKELAIDRTNLHKKINYYNLSAQGESSA